MMVEKTNRPALKNIHLPNCTPQQEKELAQGMVRVNHLYRSALEGVGYSIAQQIARMRSHENVEIDRIIAVGGGTLNPVWMQIITDILGTPICTPEITLGACFGDAMMAALAVKHPGFNSYDSLTRYIREGTVYTPNPENHRVYAQYQVLYDQLYPVTAELTHRLASLAEQ